MDHTTDHGAMLARMESLERQVRRLKCVGAVVLAIVGVTLTVAAGPAASIVKARMFIVVDDHGKERAQLGLSSEGEGMLSLLDAHETHRASLGLYEGGEPYLKLAEKRGRARVWLQAMDDERGGRLTGFYLADDRARSRATLSLDASDSPALTFLDDDGHSRVWLASNAKGASFLVLGDDHARPRLSLRADDDGKPALQLFDKNARPRLMLAMTAPDTPYLTLNDRDGNAIFTAPQAPPRLATNVSPFPH